MSIVTKMAKCHPERKHKSKGLCQPCYHASEKHRATARKHNFKVRLDAIRWLGNKCVKCGFDDVRALQIDHTDGNGHAERKKLSPYAIYRKVLNGVNGYQVLCANCNWIKRAECLEATGRPIKSKL